MRNREELTRLVQKAQQMDPDAMNTLFEECRDPIYYFALKTVQNADIAEDITQEAMIDIFRNLEKLKDPAAFQAWSREITYRQCLHHIKKTPETTVAEDEDGHSIFDTLEEENAAFIPEAAVDNEEFRKTVHAMIDSLPAEQRAALLMYHFDDLSIKEIAQIQGVSENTVKSRLNYARKAVKSSVEVYEKKHGIKLHSFAVAPFLAWLLVAQASATTMPAAASAATAAGVTAATGVAVSAATGTSAGVAGAGTAVAAATKAAVPLAVKITAGVAAAGIVAGGIAVGAGLFKKPAKEKEEVIKPRYESIYMEIYAQSDRYQETFEAILGDDTAEFILTEDNEAYPLDDPETNILEGKDVQEVYFADRNLCYVDSDGVTHILFGTEDAPIPGMEGRVLLYRVGLFDQITICTLSGTNLLGTEYNYSTGEIITLNKTWKLLENEQENNEVVRFYCNTINTGLDHETNIFAETESGQYYTTLLLGGRSRITPALPDGTEVTVDRCLAMPLSFLVGSPLFTIEGDDRHIYHSSSQYTYELDNCLELPDNRTTDELKQALFGYNILLLFEDGTVYESHGDTFEKIEQLSEIGEGGHIERLYYSNATADRLLVLMDDNVLYQYVEDPAPEDENLEKLRGTYEGTFESDQGEAGMTLTVMRQDGEYKALLEFYSLPGEDNLAPGSFYMEVYYDEETETYELYGSDWVVSSDDYWYSWDIAGKLDGKTFEGTDPTEFSVTRKSK